MKRIKKISIKIVVFAIIVLILLFNIITLIEHKDASLESKALYILHSFFSILVFVALPLIIYYADKNSKKKVIKESLSNIDLKKSKDYYREILKNHTPIELSYIDNFETGYTKDVIATLLNLELKKKITIKDNYINIINKDISNLQKSEIYLLENIKDGKLINLDSYEILGYAKEEAINNGLIVKNKTKRKEYKKLTTEKNMTLRFLSMFLLTITLVFFYQNVVDFLNNIVLPNIHIIMPILIILCLLIIFIAVQKFYNSVKDEAYYQYKSRSYKRTEEGEILNRKIEGLKNYLKDFSLLNEREQQELILWEEYLIYSVLFNINHKIIKELSLLIEDLKET